MSTAVTLNGDLVPLPTNSAGPTTQAINDQTGTAAYTLVLSDAQKLVISSSNNFVYIPLHSAVPFPVGTWIEVSCVDPSSFTGSLTIAKSSPSISFHWSAGASGGTSVGETYAWSNQTVKLRNIAPDVWEATIYPVVAGDAAGVLKPDGNGWLQLATPGTDYLSPNGDGSGLFGVAKPADITLSAIQSAASISPFSGSGSFTNFTITNGFITAAS